MLLLLVSKMSRDQVESAYAGQHLMQCQGWMQVSHQRTGTASDEDLQLQSLPPPVQLAIPAGVAAPTITATHDLF